MSYNAGGSINWYKPPWKRVWHNRINPDVLQTLWPSNSRLTVFLKETITHMHPETRNQCMQSSPDQNSPSWKHSRGLPPIEWIKKSWYSHSIKCYSATKQTRAGQNNTDRSYKHNIEQKKQDERMRKVGFHLYKVKTRRTQYIVKVTL